MKRLFDDIIAVRGGGDLATGVIQRLHRAGMRVVVLEVEKPMAIRRTVSLCVAVTQGTAQVEDMLARRANSVAECESCWAAGEIPVMVDPEARLLPVIRPDGVVDAILAKRNLGTSKDMAKIVIALGPGFCAGEDCHAVIETMRGHNLGRMILGGPAQANTGIPGEIGGQGSLRVLRAKAEGEVHLFREIGDIVQAGDNVLEVQGEVISAPFDGIIRGLIESGTFVPKGMKIGDIDPRRDSDCYTISDKARCIGGGVLESYLYFKNRL